ncbi:MAG TPA: DUF952 domain-containing protein [Anaerolineaceae bacterium]|jgi:uncharacterized protein (DUF952 family)|nr:DUF952 domain-containing protein [Anaerolineaceae bacterium]NMC17731.1 DUF952 domain-containing protein [Chloroflexota bacterium]HNW13992.1 DUF952 domain-containing protein [Anaerolineaceae bacterium]HOE03283.1 DUF952 domain-containing protein [Anaerolineaceae bacterium]HPD63242.1 DUF952 domain-containing protein [Anaerolineaceae bacterium]
MFIYHITEKKTWQDALLKGVYIPNDFAKDGFIHCSLESQVLAVAEKYFKQTPDLLLLKIDTHQVISPLVFENLEGGDENYPHIYGALSLSAIVGYLPLSKDRNSCFFFPNFS